MGGSERDRVDEAFASGYIAPCGPMVDRFERAFAERTGIPHACALSSGTAALDLLFHELGIGPGDRVFCSDLTFIASVAPAVRRGAEPVFIDCDETSWTMDPDLLAEALAQAAAEGRLPKAVVAVDLYGQCCDYGRIEPLCERYGVPLITDAAEALGAVYCDHPVVAMGSVKSAQDGRGAHEKDDMGKCEAGCPDERKVLSSSLRSTAWSQKVVAMGSVKTVRSAGDAGWAAVFSFNGNKIITTSGGGMVASRDAGVIERARKRAQQAREPVVWYEHEELGYNYRMSNLVAAVGVGQLEALERIIAKKRQIFEWYRERLEGVAGVSLMPEAGYGRCSRWLTVALLRPPSGRNGECKNGPDERVMRVIEALERENIEARPVWKPMHLQPVFQGARVVGGAVSEQLFAHGICLPSGTGIERADVERICNVVIKAVRTGADVIK